MLIRYGGLLEARQIHRVVRPNGVGREVEVLRRRVDTDGYEGIRQKHQGKEEANFKIYKDVHFQFKMKKEGCVRVGYMKLCFILIPSSELDRREKRGALYGIGFLL